MDNADGHYFSPGAEILPRQEARHPGHPNAACKAVEHHTGVDEPTVKTVIVGKKTSGETVRENLLVKHVGNNLWQVCASPGLAEGIAAGDVVSVDDEAESFQLVKRGGNIGVHVHPTANGIGGIPRLITVVESLGGTCDGGIADQLVILTFPYALGFNAIESLLNDYLERDQGSKWFYNNVYDEEGEPLGWWMGFPS